MSKGRVLSNREFKSSAFTTYYGTPENAADLYRGLEHADHVTPEDIRYTTLAGVMFMARKNDPENLIPSKEIYRTGRISIPTPEFYSFYNGKKELPAERILKLSDAYLEKTSSPMLQLVVREININPSAGHPILKSCRSLYEYSAFIQKIRDYMDSGEERGDAIAEAMEASGVLELEEEYVEQVMELFRIHPEADDIQIAAMLLEECEP